MPPPRPASGDTIYVMYADRPMDFCMSMLACQYDQPKRPGDLDLESGVRVVICDVGYLCANFSLLRPLSSRVTPDVRDRQLSDKIIA